MLKSPTDGVKPIVPKLLGEAAFIYVAKAKELSEKGYDVITFGVGQPDVPTFPHIIEAAKQALDEHFTGYTETAGIPELRGGVANYLNRRYSAGVKSSEVVITPGAKAAIFLSIASYLDPGDEIIVPEPAFPAYSEVAYFVGAKPVFVPLKWKGPEGGFSLDVDMICESITKKTKMIVLNNPQNPTGALFAPSETEKVYQMVKENGLVLVADEIYENFIYDYAPYKSVLTEGDWKDYVIYINGFSKTFSMTGWRLGYLVVKDEIAQKLTRLGVNVYSCATSFAQKGALRAITGPWEPVKEMIALFQKRRDLMAFQLRKIPGFDVWPSKGAFYMFPKVSRILEDANLTSEQLVEYLINRCNVITLPGTVFPDKAGAEFLRFSFASSNEAIKKGSERIREAISELMEKKK
ncbi:MAG: pyridoxal phosphate-dependent aminotransferase [Nitrososphaeria archaeon]